MTGWDKEQYGTDPLMRVTDHMTNAIKRLKKLFGVQDSTVIMSRDFFEYCSKYEFWGSEYGLNDPMYRYRTHVDQTLMISHEGKGREQLVLLGSHMNQPFFGDDPYAVPMIRHKRAKERKLKNYDEAEIYNE